MVRRGAVESNKLLLLAVDVVERSSAVLRSPTCLAALAIIGEGAVAALINLVITCSLHSITHCLSILSVADFGMWIGWARCARRVVRHNVKASRRLLSTQTPQADLLSKTTRNIGIVAHIDAVSGHIRA